MTVNLLESIATHLEFLGYEITPKEDILQCRHARKYNLLVRRLSGGFLFTTIFAGDKEFDGLNNIDLLKSLNFLNKEAIVSRFYVDDDCDLFMEAWYPDYYDRIAFGLFFDILERDMKQMAKSNISEYFQ
jgi:hypothetical protein